MMPGMLHRLLLALLVLPCLQDGDLAPLLKALADDDIVVRDQAVDDLAKLPPARLPDLERAMDAAAPELKPWIGMAAGRILGRSLAPRALRFELRPVVAGDLLAAWKRDGSDPAKAPPGTRALRNAEARDPEPAGDWILVEAAVAVEDDILKAEAREIPAPMGTWVIDVVLGAPAAKRFDEAAARLFAQEPRGKVAMVLDGEVRAAPSVQTPKFGGQLSIMGALGEEEAKTRAKWLRSEWFETSLEVRPAAGGDPEPAARILVERLGIKRAALVRHADGSITARSKDRLEDSALYAAWRDLRKAGFTLGPAPAAK